MQPAVVGAYGATMLIVQAWELGLASLVLAVERLERVRPATGLEDMVRDVIKLVHTCSAGQMQSRLDGLIRKELNDDIKYFVHWRNFLAHRYLRTRLCWSGAVVAQPQHLLELLALGEAFGAASERLKVATFDALADNPAQRLPGAGPAPQAFIDALNAVINAQPPVFTGLQSEPPDD